MEMADVLNTDELVRTKFDLSALDKGWKWLDEGNQELQGEWERAAIHLTWARKLLKDAQAAYEEAKEKFDAVDARLDASLGMLKEKGGES